jgi:hypothetical protein
LYGFTRFSMALGNHSNKSYSFYTHPHFIRGQRDRVRCMIRCKIKGTGKKRHDDDDDEDEECEEVHREKKRLCRRDYAHQDPTIEPLNLFTLLPEDEKDDECEWKTESYATALLSPTDEAEEWVPLPLTLDVNPEGAIEDGELAFFEGNPFHFLEPPTSLNPVPLPKPLPLEVQPIDGGEFASAVWPMRNESWFWGDRSRHSLPKILNREQQRMILDPSVAVLSFNDHPGPWYTNNVGSFFRTAQV